MIGGQSLPAAVSNSSLAMPSSASQACTARSLISSELVMRAIIQPPCGPPPCGVDKLQYTFSNRSMRVEQSPTEKATRIDGARPPYFHRIYGESTVNLRCEQ